MGKSGNAKLANIICINRKASFEYEILSRYDAGIVLFGCEVKPVRAKGCNISSAYIGFDKGRAVIYNMHIDNNVNSFDKPDCKRARYLLLKKREINKLIGQSKEKGITFIPLSVKISDTGFVKVEFGLCRGKKLYDKRESIKQKELSREKQQILKTVVFN